jgi:hypothetical protein
LDNARQTLGAILGPAIDDSDIAAVDPTQRGETVVKCVEKALIVLPSSRVDKAGPPHRDLG